MSHSRYLLLSAGLTLSAFLLKPSHKNYVLLIEKSCQETASLIEQTPAQKLDSYSFPWLSLFELKQICPEVFTFKFYAYETQPWKELPHALALPQSTHVMKKPLKKSRWDGRDFEQKDDAKGI